MIICRIAKNESIGGLTIGVEQGYVFNTSILAKIDIECAFDSVSSATCVSVFIDAIQYSVGEDVNIVA